MSIEGLLDLIRHRFSPSEGQTLVRSLQQDPLVWQFAQDEEKSLPYFESAPNDLVAYSPGKIAAWLIEQATEVPLQALSSLDFTLPNDLRQRASQAYETIFNTGLPPADLMTAGLLALTLRERRILKGNWQGIADDILIKRNPPAFGKNYRVWRTPFACLYNFCLDYDNIITAFLQSNSDPVIKTAIPIFIHAFLSNPLEPHILLDRLYSMVNNLPIDQQLESLKWLEAFQYTELRKTVAKNLIQSKNNVDTFARIFSELEAFESNSIDTDQLDKQVRYTLPEDVNRLAAFYFYSGIEPKAAEMYQKSSDLLDFIKSQTIFQSLACNPDRTSPSQWLKIIKSVPTSKQVRLFYIQSLIAERNFDEAAKHLEELPASPEKQYLQFLIEQSKDTKIGLHGSAIVPIKIQSGEKVPPSSGYYVHNVKMDTLEESLNTILRIDDLGTNETWVENLHETSSKDPKIVRLLRDFSEKQNKIDKAIELTSYLERIEPEDKTHKRSLARLYILAKRWQDAFNTLQELTKSEPSIDIEDLGRFAEASLKTDRVDMAISICQNILKEDGRNSKALVLLGEGYMLKGDIVKSIQHMEQVVEMLPEKAETWLTLASLWQKSGQTDRGLEILNKGSLALPNNPDLLRALGKAYLEKQAPSDAQTCLIKAHAIEPKNIEGKLDLARAEYQLGKYEQAWQLLESFMGNYEKNPKIANLLGHVLLAMDKPQIAEPVLLFAAKNYPEDIETVLTATRLVLTRAESSLENVPDDELEKLRVILQNAIGKSQKDGHLKLHLADIDRLQGLYQQAMDAYSKLAESEMFEKSTSNWRLQFGLGKSAFALGFHDVGLAALQEAASKQPENLTVLHALADAYQSAQLFGKAQNTAKSALKLAPQDMRNILWYANFKTRNNEPEEAVKALKEALQINPDRSELKLWLAKTLISIGSMEESKETITNLIENSVSTPDELHQAAYICVHLNELELAVKALEKAHQLAENFNPTLLMDLAISYSLLDQQKKALEILNLDNGLITKFPELALLKSDLLCNLNQYEMAISTLKAIKDIAEGTLPHTGEPSKHKAQSPLFYSYDFTFKGYLYRLGQLSRVMGEIEEAQAYFSKGLGLAHDDVTLRNAAAETFMAALCFDQTLKVATSEPQEGAAFDGIGHDRLDLICTQVESLLLLGEKGQAATLFNQLSPVSGTYPRYLAIQSRLAAGLGEIEIAKEHLNEAIQSYQESLENPQSPSLQNFFRQLANLNSIAEAALSLDDLIGAIKLHQQIWSKLNNQPLQNWRYALTLIKSAEFQRIAEALSIKAHAPGSQILSENSQNIVNILLESLQPYLSQEQLMCLKARGVAAFTGNWPLSLNADACLIGPEEAAAVILGSDDEAFVLDILESYSDEPLVLQAYGIHTLRFNKEDGVPQVEKALGMDTSNPINHVLLALLNNNVPEQAVKSLETALDFWPDESEWHALAADLYTRIGNSELASHHIALALNAQPENGTYWQKSAELKLQNNDLAHAREDLEKSASFQSKNPGVWLSMANVNRRMGNIPEAIQNIQMAIELKPNDVDIAAQEVQFLLEQKNFSDAENKADEILQNEESEPVRILLAQSQAKQGKFDQALKTLMTSSEKNSENTRLVLESIKIRKDRDGTETILPELVNLAHDNPNDPAILTTLTDWLIQTNRLKKAEETAQTILRIIPEQAEVHLMLGRLQRKNGQLDQAIAHLSDAITLDPCLIEAYIELGKTYQERRDLEEAIKVFQKGSLADAADPRPYYFAGMALKECKDYTGAEAMLKQAKKYSPDDANIIRQLGVITALNLINNLRETR